MKTEKIRKFHYSRDEVADLIAEHQAKIKSVANTSFWFGFAGGCVQSLLFIIGGLLIYWALK